MTDEMASDPPVLYWLIIRPCPVGTASVPPLIVEVCAPTLGVTSTPPPVSVLVPESVSVLAAAVLKRTSLVSALVAVKGVVTSVCAPLAKELAV
jgi:hypothetical protein